jgi:hypothetical protein
VLNLLTQLKGVFFLDVGFGYDKAIDFIGSPNLLEI